MKRTQRPSHPPYSTDRAVLEREVVIEAFRTGGPGGQHRNVTDSAIRLLHVPSGIRIVIAESRSQYRNRECAFVRLIERLRQLNRVRRPRISMRVPRQVVERRLAEKRRRQTIKQKRSRVEGEEE